MDKLFYAEANLKEIKEKIEKTELFIIEQLEKGAPLSTITPLEREAFNLHQAAEDASSIISYYQLQGDIQRSSDIYKIFFCATRGPAIAKKKPLSNVTINKKTTEALSGDTVTVNININSNNASNKDNASVNFPACQENALLAALSVRLSEDYINRGISSLLVISDKHVFGVIEGKEVDAKATFKELENVHNYNSEASTVISSLSILNFFVDIIPLTFIHVESRKYNLGLKFYVLPEDSVISMILSKCRDMTLLGARFAPTSALDLCLRGGDPSGTVMKSPVNYIILALTLNMIGGFSYSPTVYNDVADKVAEVISIQKGHSYYTSNGGSDIDMVKGSVGNTPSIVEKFGEYMIVIFPRVGSLPASFATECAFELLFGDKHCVTENILIAVTTGFVVVTDKNYCQAFGEGIRNAKRLLALAESERRPLIMTEDVAELMSKLKLKPYQFTINNVAYYTLPESDERTIDVLPSKYEVYQQSNEYNIYGNYKTTKGGKFEIINVPNENIVQLKPAMGKNDFNLVNVTCNSGDKTVEEFVKLFKSLDECKNGWITKAQFRDLLLSERLFVVFPNDSKKIDCWIEQCSSLGPTRMSLNEFILVCLKIKQL